MSRSGSGIVRFCGLLAAVWILASVSGFGWAQQRDSMALRGLVSESPFIRVQGGGCKNMAAFNTCQAAENNKPGGCNWASSCSGQVNRDCASKYC